MPRKGDIAVCMHGYLGLITKDIPEIENPPGGGVGSEIWHGVQLTARNGRQIGSPWQSRRPKVLCHIFDLLAAGGDYIPSLVPHLREAGVRGLVGIDLVNLDSTRQPYEPPRYVPSDIDGVFDDDISYNGD